MVEEETGSRALIAEAIRREKLVLCTEAAMGGLVSDFLDWDNGSVRRRAFTVGYGGATARKCRGGGGFRGGAADPRIQPLW